MQRASLLRCTKLRSNSHCASASSYPMSGLPFQSLNVRTALTMSTPSCALKQQLRRHLNSCSDSVRSPICAGGLRLEQKRQIAVLEYVVDIFCTATVKEVMCKHC